jgi:hypothetical protein
MRAVGGADCGARRGETVAAAGRWLAEEDLPMCRSFVPMLAVLGLAACNQAPAPAPTASATAQAAPAEGFAQRIRDLPAGQRAGVFLRAIRDGKENCQEITGEYEIAAVEGRPAWAVTCDRTDPWIVSIDPGGTAIVTKASTASRLPPKTG